jgi:hypothetical protein
MRDVQARIESKPEVEGAGRVMNEVEKTKETKVCIQCGHPKSLDDFYRVKKGEERRNSRCKPCDNAVRAMGSLRNFKCRMCGEYGHTPHSPRCAKKRIVAKTEAG